MSQKAPAQPLTPTLKTRRVVTGHDADGKSIILRDGSCPVSVSVWHEDMCINDAWRVDRLPTNNAGFTEPCTKLELEAGPTGNVCRIVQFPPDRLYVAAADAKAGFSDMGETGVGANTGTDDGPHPLMHRTNTIDYIIVVSGEIYAVMERGEVLLKQGDILIQRGTNHAWSNRSDKPCIIAAILNGADPLSGG